MVIILFATGFLFFDCIQHILIRFHDNIHFQTFTEQDQGTCINWRFFLITWKPNEILVIRIFCQLFNEFPVEYWYFVWMINEPRARRNGLATRPFFPLNRLEYFFSKPPWNSICHFYPSVFRVHVKSYWLIEIQKVTLCIISIFVHYFPLHKWYFSIENCTKKI